MSFGGGAGGSSQIATSGDVALSNPANGQVLAYNTTLGKWQNVAAPDTQHLPSYAAGRTNVFEPRYSLYNFKASNTRRYRAGLARAGRADYTGSGQFLNEIWFGDSIMGGCTGLGKGTGADTTRFDRLNSAPKFYERFLSQLTGIPIAGTGMVRCCDGSHLDPRFTLVGSTSMSSTCITVPTGSSLVFTSNMPGDTVIVTYYDNFNSSTTGFNVSVNGASSGSNFASVIGSSTSKYKYVTLSGVTGLTTGSTVTMASPSVTVQLAFIEVRDSSGGLSVSNIALSGSSATGSGNTGWTTTGSGFAAMRQVTDNTALPYTPDVVNFGWGLFDAYPTVIDQTTYHNALTTIRNYFPNSDCILWALPTPLQLNDTTWLPFLSTVFQVADELDLPVVDAHDLIGGGAGAQALGLNADSTAHYLPPIYQMWARAASRAAA